MQQAMPLDERFNYSFDIAFFYKALKASRKVILSHFIFSQMHVYPTQKTYVDDRAKFEEGTILRSDYAPKATFFRRLMSTPLHIFLVCLIPILYRKQRQKFLRMERDVSAGKWTITTV